VKDNEKGGWINAKKTGFGFPLWETSVDKGVEFSEKALRGWRARPKVRSLTGDKLNGFDFC